MTISEIGVNDAYEMTGLSVPQLHRLFHQLRIPEVITEPGRYSFSGEEAFLHYMVFNQLGDTKLKMSINHFGGDPRRFTYSIRLIGKHIYETCYHKVSGDSMRMWMPKIADFRYAIWENLRRGATVEETVYSDAVASDVNLFIFLGIPFKSFLIFGFLDDTWFRNTAPGRST